MNRSMIVFMVGRILRIEALLMGVPFLVSLYYGESSLMIKSWIIPIGLLLAVSLLMTARKPKSNRFYAREGLVICGILWFALSFFGALPMWMSGSCDTLVDAFFEISSGFTTTGASVIRNVEGLTHSALFWRSFTHLIGGMGVLVFALALAPKTNADSVHMMKAEVPGPTFGKLVSKLSHTARILYIIYLVMTAVVIVLLIAGGMPVFDSFCHAFGAAGTGGFGIKNNSVAYYHSSYIHNVLSFSMLAFGVNFNLYYLILLKKYRQFVKDEELHWYIAFVIIAVVLIMINIAPMYDNFPIMLRDVFFTVSSIITTTGYSTVDFNTWPLFSHIILLFLMFIGACAGSTAGGLKVSRVAVVTKSTLSEFRRMREPNRVLPVTFNKQVIGRSALRGLQGYMMAYFLVFSILLLIVSLESPNFQTAFSAVAATFNNIGPGLDVVGPTGSFAGFTPFTKMALSFGMIAGRLEIWPVLIMFSPRTWTSV